MALRMQTQATRFGSYTERNFTTERIARVKVAISTEHPATMTWVMYAPQHTLPIAINTFVRLWDEGQNDPDGNAYTASNPLFEGFVADVKPGDHTNTVEYTAYDPTYKAQTDTNVMSRAWLQGTVPNTPPTEDPVAYPRLILNSTIQNDDDWAFCRAFEQSTGNIVKGLLVDQYHPLYWLNAAPGDGTSAGNGVAYVDADLASWTHVPQEKLVFESEDVRSAVYRIMQEYEPHYRMLWRPGSRKWRFFDITGGSQVTLTLNDFSGDNDVLTLSLDRSMQDRYTAVKFYGPEVLTPAIASTVDGTLDLGNYRVLEYVGAKPILSHFTFQIRDGNKRRMARILPAEIWVGMSSYLAIPVKAPTFQISYDYGQTWASLQGWYCDANNGIIYLGEGVAPYIYTESTQDPGNGGQNYFPPTDYRIIYAYYDTPITTRYPTSGFAGTAFTVGGQRNEWRLYDEMLAVGYNWFGTAVTTSARLAEFQKLAQQIHANHKDIVYQGGCTLNGLRYQFAHLNRRVNFDGIDEAASNVNTGWESINCVVTDVEYDFEEMMTSLTFSSDQMELTGFDPERFKQRLKIRALELRRFNFFRVLPGVIERRYTEWGTPFLHSNLRTELVSFDAWVNPETGEITDT